MSMSKRTFHNKDDVPIVNLTLGTDGDAPAPAPSDSKNNQHMHTHTSETEGFEYTYMHDHENPDSDADHDTYKNDFDPTSLADLDDANTNLDVTKSS
eukprot:122948_1